MCGIFGIVKKDNSDIEKEDIKNRVKYLFRLSESRGKDASGIALVSDRNIEILKSAISASKFIKTSEYKSLFSSRDNISALIGHARMETDGSFMKSFNNQPVVKDGCVTVHNGIVVNHRKLWEKYKKLNKEYEVDTEIINSLLRYYIDTYKDKVQAVRSTLRQIKGSYSIGVLFSDLNLLLLATNTGSLYFMEDKAKELNLFVSEEYFAKRFISKQKEEFYIRKIKPKEAVLIDLDDLSKVSFNINKKDKVEIDIDIRKRNLDIKKVKIKKDLDLKNIIKKNDKNEGLLRKIVNNEYEKNKAKIAGLKRCTRCILPETMPFIEFDKDGVCNYCHNYQKREVRGKSKLLKDLRDHKINRKKNNCIVSFSGGRDSSYALHYVKKVLGLNPLAFSYDWGMLTDLGRRNQARMTGLLGVEHILVSANIRKKREYIKKNVLAWLKKPHIGMVPLFMAGDKQYFYYLNKVQKETGIDLVIYADNSLEKTDFKYGFADVYLTPEVGKAYAIGKLNTIKLLFFYLKQYLANPSYINSSLIDTFTAYISSYFVPKDYLYLYRYIPWDEKKIEKTLLNEYDWEISSDTKNTWRIGDGTAAFYNYIYYTITGLTENDTFRSNQIREGLLTREEGMKLAIEGNKPRIESLIWYANTIGIDLKYALGRINKMEKLY